MSQFFHPIGIEERYASEANALQEGIGGQFGEMRIMMQYLFHYFNFCGEAKSHTDDPHHFMLGARGCSGGRCNRKIFLRKRKFPIIIKS